MKKSAIASALGQKATMAPPLGVSHTPANAQVSHMARPGNIDGNFPAGVYSDSVSQAMTPFMGGNQMPNGQMINVTMNAPNPHLSFKEWAGRGIVSAIGAGARWPFRFVTGILEQIAHAIVGLLAKLALFILLPTMLVVGFALANKISHAGSVEAGVRQIMHDGRHAASGAAAGMTDDLPPEEQIKPDDHGKSPKHSKTRHAE